MKTNLSTISVEKNTSSKLSSVDFNNLSFGSVFTDHMLVCNYGDGEWQSAKVVPYGPISLNPAAKIFHYGQSIFEGMKAYKDDDGQVWLFRPMDNFIRMNRSAERLAMPTIPEEFFMDGLKTLLELDKDWIPTTPGSSLYIRPFMFGSGEGFHASPADAYTFIIALAPSGKYFSGEVRVVIEESYSRAANGGVGYVKAGGNYAAQFYPTQLAKAKGYQQVIWTDDNTHEFLEEAGAMNVFARIGDTLITAPNNDRILDGITRKSALRLAEDMGIKTEVRKISVHELIAAANNGELKELFGTGTAAVVSSISGFAFKGVDYELPKLDDGYASRLKKRITDIQFNRSEDPYGWRYRVS